MYSPSRKLWMVGVSPALVKARLPLPNGRTATLAGGDEAPVPRDPKTGIVVPVVRVPVVPVRRSAIVRIVVPRPAPDHTDTDLTAGAKMLISNFLANRLPCGRFHRCARSSLYNAANYSTRIHKSDGSNGEAFRGVYLHG